MFVIKRVADCRFQCDSEVVRATLTFGISLQRSLL